MFIPHTDAERGAMLASLGMRSIDQLFSEIPKSVRFPKLNLTDRMTDSICRIKEMIQFSKISTRYAKAIYEYAAENKAETTLYREFRTLAASFLSLPQMRDLLDNPTLEKPKKLAVLRIWKSF